LSEHNGVVRVEAHPTFHGKCRQFAFPLLANHAQADFRNKLVIVFVAPGAMDQTKDD